ncbi:hypothetical protein Tsubulata_029534 [Turnera subulata]|uniref:Cytochrome P450 n=1 Tax=Turnera subulata TaxID=218843 RepID=A0A9Q0GFR7_9ROSI|nr:hypothetical protein Tsubulata_029534 [Turnera subulata]
MEITLGWRIVLSLAVIGIACTIRICGTVLLRALRIKRKLRMQGITGPSPSFPYGNLREMHQIQMKTVKARNHGGDLVGHDYTSTIFPYFEHWRNKYGLVYTYSTGLRQHLYINDPGLVTEMNQLITMDLGKPSYVTKRLGPMLGTSILRSNGNFWAEQRKIIAPEFFMDKVKCMMGLMVESAQPLLSKWEGYIEAQGGVQADIRVDKDLRSLSAEVIARACFGSSYLEGKEIFSRLVKLKKLLTKHSLLFDVTSFKLFPSKNKERIRELEREVNTLIWKTVEERRQSQHFMEGGALKKDLMQLLLEEAISTGANKRKVTPKSFIVDNCKSLYFAGHDSTATAASWCIMLLASHPEWQSRIREEVTQFCKDGSPDANSLSNLKAVTMVIQEALRLYPPAAFVSREALEEVQIGSITVPKGAYIWTLIPTLHRDPNVWGPDANEFKPERFQDGVSNACKFPQAYVPFGLGPRLCSGRNFALVQLKLVLSLIVAKFEFSLSPNYRHSPCFRMIVEPEHGVQIVIRKA